MPVPLTIADDGEHVVLVYDDDDRTHPIEPEDAEFLADALREAAETVRQNHHGDASSL